MLPISFRHRSGRCGKVSFLLDLVRSQRFRLIKHLQYNMNYLPGNKQSILTQQRSPFRLQLGFLCSIHSIHRNHSYQ